MDGLHACCNLRACRLCRHRCHGEANPARSHACPHQGRRPLVLIIFAGRGASSPPSLQASLPTSTQSPHRNDMGVPTLGYESTDSGDGISDFGFASSFDLGFESFTLLDQLGNYYSPGGFDLNIDLATASSMPIPTMTRSPIGITPIA